jgi:ABC-2 type transport system ATP-binding protein
MPAADAITIRDAAAGYGRRAILDGLSLAVPEGSVTALLGRNGAGKSTLFRLLLGLLPRRRGEVFVLGLDPARAALAVKERTGFVPESADLNPRFRVRDVIALVRGLRRRRWDDAEERRLAAVFDLPPRTRIGALSKGMKAKLTLLLALAPRPDLLLLDEPASGLDPVVRREVLSALVDEIAREGRTVLMASHRMDDVERLADRVAFLDGGRIVRAGPVEAVRAEAGNLEGVFMSLLSESKEVVPCEA